MFHIGLNRANMKKSSCLKLKGLEPRYLVCSITSRSLPSLFKLYPLGQTLASIGGHMFYIGLFRM